MNEDGLWTLSTGNKVHLPKLIILPFVVIDARRSPFFIGAKPRATDDFQQPAVRAKRAHVFTFVGPRARPDRPSVEDLREIGTAISRVNDRGCRTTGATTHDRNCVMTGEVDAFFLKLLANASAK